MHFLRRNGGVAAILTTLVLVPTQVQAQERDPAAAQALFEQGQAAMNAGRFAEACGKLAESLRLDPGIGTQFHLAACHEHEGKIASAWAAFHEVASLATASGQDARAKAASRRASLLEPRLPRLTIVVSPDARAAGLEVTRDGIVVGEAQWGVAVPVDPGAHRVEVTAPGRRAFAGSVTAAEGATSTLEVPVLEATIVAAGEVGPVVAPPGSGTGSAPPAPDTTSTVHDSPRESSSGPSGLVIGLGIGGIVAVGAGSILGVMAMNENDDSKEHCDPEDANACDGTGKDLRDDARLFGNLATVGFIVGGAALTTAVVLWLVDDGDDDRGESEDGVAISVGPLGVGVHGVL
jgi:hypothetical protein